MEDVANAAEALPRSPIITFNRIRHRRPILADTPKILETAISVHQLKFIPETPHESEDNNMVAVTASRTSFNTTGNATLLEGTIAAPDTQEASLPSSYTYCSLVEELLNKDSNNAGANKQSEETYSTFCSIFELAEQENNEPKPQLYGHTGLSQENTSKLITSVEHQARSLNEFESQDTVILTRSSDTELVGKSSQTQTQASLVQDTESAHGHSSQLQFAMPRTLRGARGGRRGKGHARRGRGAHIILETPPDSGSLLSSQSPQCLLTSSAKSHHSKTKPETLSPYILYGSKVEDSKEQLEGLKDRIRVIRHAVNHWVKYRTGLKDPSQTKLEVASIEREARALKRRSDGTVKKDLEHVLQACESITFQLEYVPHDISQSKYSVCCSKRRCISTYCHKQQFPKHLGELPSIKELMNAGLLRVGYWNLTLIVEGKQEELGALTSNGHIRTKNNKVFSTAEIWYMKVAGKKVTRYEAYQDILYYKESLISICSEILAKKSQDSRHQTRKKCVLRRESEDDTQSVSTVVQEDKLQPRQSASDAISTSEDEEIRFESNSDSETYFSEPCNEESLENLPMDETIKNNTNKNCKDKKCGADSIEDGQQPNTQTKNELKSPSILSGHNKKILSSVQKCSTWLSKSDMQNSDVQVSPAHDTINVKQMAKNSTLDAQAPECKKSSDDKYLKLTSKVDKKMWVKERLTASNIALDTNDTGKVENTTVILSKAATENQTKVDSVMHQLDSERRAQFEDVSYNLEANVTIEKLESWRTSKRAEVLKVWRERVIKWKTDPGSVLRQSMKYKPQSSQESDQASQGHSLANQTREQLACMVSELTEKVKTLENNLEEMRKDAKSVSANQKLDALATNHEKNNSNQDPFRVSLDGPQKTVSTPDHPHTTMKQTQGNESQSKREPLGIPTPRFASQPSNTQKCRGNENESQQERVKRNLSTWFASTSKHEDYQSQASQDFEKTKIF